MAPVEGPRPKKYHPDRRRELLVLADVRLFQALVIDKDGEETGVVIWQCGTDVLVSRTMSGIFTGEGRVNAPRWLREQLTSLSPSRRFYYDGTSYTHEKAEPEGLPTQEPEPEPEVQTPGDELGGFQEG